MCAGLAAAAAASAVAAESVRLRYRLEPQARYEQRMTMATTMHVEIEGLPPEQAATLGGMLGQDMQQKLSMTMNLETGSRDADGGVPFEMRIGQLEGGMTVGGREIPIPDSEHDVRMKGKLGSDGRMLEVDTAGMEALGDVMPTDVVDRLLKLMPPFPERELAVGETLTVPQSYEIPFPGMPDAELRVEGATTFTLRGVEPGGATFDVESNAAIRTDPTEGSGMDVRLSGGGRGAAVFDSEQGLFSRIAMDMTIEMHMNLPAEAALAEGAAAGPLVMNMSMKGPVEITMSRVGG
jgi:hypothetical protein